MSFGLVADIVITDSVSVFANGCNPAASCEKKVWYESIGRGTPWPSPALADGPALDPLAGGGDQWTATATATATATDR